MNSDIIVAIIGCGGVVVAAIITGIFSVVAKKKSKGDTNQGKSDNFQKIHGDFKELLNNSPPNLPNIQSCIK